MQGCHTTCQGHVYNAAAARGPSKATMQFYMLLQERVQFSSCEVTRWMSNCCWAAYVTQIETLKTPEPVGCIMQLCSQAHLGPVLSEGEGDANLGAWVGAGLPLGPLFTATIRLCAILKGSSSEAPGLACLEGVLPANSASFLPTLACKRWQILRLAAAGVLGSCCKKAICISSQERGR